MKPKIAALVPMRHKSERIPGKNYRRFLKRPLCEYVLDTLEACPLIDEIVVDTDSPTIREICAENHPKVRLLERPEHLRGGEVSMNEVLLHDVGEVTADYYVQTHCTNPLLTTDTVTQAIEAFLEARPAHDSLFSVTPQQTRLWGEDARAINHDPATLERTQDLTPVYEENSCLYIFSGESLKETRCRIGRTPKMFIMDRLEAIDIDEEIDFTLAKAVFGLSRAHGQDDLYYFGHHKCATHWMRRFLKPVTRLVSCNYRVLGGKQPNDVPFDSYDRSMFLFVNSREKLLRGISRAIRGFHLMRDPRDAFVSNYFSRRYSHALHNEKQRVLRDYLNENSKEDGLVYLLSDDDGLKQMDNWEPGEFPNVLEVKYEDLLQNEMEVFTQVLAHLGIHLQQERLAKIINKCSFTSLSGGRDRGNEDEKSHYRKGVAGDWVNHMPPGSKPYEAFHERWGHLVEKFGYPPASEVVT